MGGMGLRLCRGPKRSVVQVTRQSYSSQPGLIAQQLATARAYSGAWPGRLTSLASPLMPSPRIEFLCWFYLAEIIGVAAVVSRNSP